MMLSWRTIVLALLGSLGLVGCSQSAGLASSSTPIPDGQSGETGLSPIEQLGKKLFFDTNLSEPPGQPCAVCHAPEVGWTGPEAAVNAGGAVYEGAVHGRFGNSKPPSSAYAAFSPRLHQDPTQVGAYLGGNFWDGRATGEKLGNPAADQAQGPFLNPLEQNNPSGDAVVAKVCASDYADLFRQVFGAVCGDPKAAYDDIARAIAAFEASSEVSPFTSRYDFYLTGQATLTQQEKRGLELFQGRAGCSGCHPSRLGREGDPPLFTDFSYDNLGVPRNPANPYYNEPEFNSLGRSWVDEGLGATLANRPADAPYAQQNRGKVKVPTLRNVDKRPSPGFVKAYGHNGYFKSLEEVVHFYNTRDVLPVCTPDAPGMPGVSCWPPPEVAENVNRTELGNLGLSAQDEADLVAFLKTLSDGFRP